MALEVALVPHTSIEPQSLGGGAQAASALDHPNDARCCRRRPGSLVLSLETGETGFRRGGGRVHEECDCRRSARDRSRNRLGSVSDGSCRRTTHTVGHPGPAGHLGLSAITPLERPSDLAGKQVLTNEEAAKFEEQENRRLNRDLVDPKKGGLSIHQSQRAALSLQRIFVRPGNNTRRGQAHVAHRGSVGWENLAVDGGGGEESSGETRVSA